VDQEAGILDAQELMAENNIRHLPVIFRKLYRNIIVFPGLPIGGNI